MNGNLEYEKYKFWINVNLINFERKLIYEDAFDGIVKVYSLNTDNNDLNKLITGKYFGEFNLISDNGIFLRMFLNKTSWPKTNLIYVNILEFKIIEINKNNSSNLVWLGKKIENGKYSIEISPNKIIEYQI